jgi:tetratricopeptide (TPR) repeat protein
VKDLPAPRGKDRENANNFLCAFTLGMIASAWSTFCGVPFLLAYALGMLVYVLLWLWRYRLSLMAYRAYKTHQFMESLELARKAIAKNPGISANYNYAAASALQLRNPTEAIEYCDSAILLAPQNAHAFQNRALAYSRLYDGERALADANQSIELRPNDTVGYIARSSAYLMLRKYKEAIDDCNFVIDRKRNANWGHVNRAIANLNMNKVDIADEDCNFVIEQIVQKPSADELAYVLLVKGSIQCRRLQFEDALANFAHSLELRPAVQVDFIESANALCALGRFQEALSILDKLEQQECSEYITAYALINRARIHMRKGELGEALNHAEAANNMYRNIPGVLASYGLILTRAGQLEKAQAMLDKAISLDSYLADAYWFRHELYEKLGETEKAKADKQVAEGYDYKPYI